MAPEGVKRKIPAILRSSVSGHGSHLSTMQNGICKMVRRQCCRFMMPLVLIFILSVPGTTPGQGFMNNSVSDPTVPQGKDLLKDADEIRDTWVKTLTRIHTYRIASLDTRTTAKAIAWERVKHTFTDEIADLLVASVKAERRSSIGKTLTKANNVIAEPLPEKAEIQMLMPCLLSIQETEEIWDYDSLVLKAKTTVTPVHLAAAITMLSKSEKAKGQIRTMRAVSTAAMAEIMRIQQTAPDEDADLMARYLKAARQLTVVDWYDKARYLSLNDRPIDAINAYTAAIEQQAGIAILHRNRGRLYLSHLRNRSKALADFDVALQAYITDARGHRKLRQYAECLEDTEQAIGLNREYTAAHFERGICHVGLQQHTEAKADFVTAARLGDKDAQKMLTSKGIPWQL